MKRLLGRLFISKKRKELLEDFVVLLREIPKVNSVEECMQGYQKIADFHKRLGNKKQDIYLKEAGHQLLQYLLDTKTHIQNGWHRPAHKEYSTVTTYPDINDYVNIGVRLNQF